MNSAYRKFLPTTDLHNLSGLDSSLYIAIFADTKIGFDKTVVTKPFCIIFIHNQIDVFLLQMK